MTPTEKSAQELAELLTMRAATVEGIEPLHAELQPIVIARVVECGRHPDSDHLSVTRVDAGGGELLDVVCGAPNVRAGALYPFAPVGTVMPGGLEIKKRKIRGAVSEGMLCSARELGLGEDHEGILELDVDARPGTSFTEAMHLGDARLEIDVLPNRPDLLSHMGIAREIAAATGGSANLPAIPGSSADSTLPPVRRDPRQSSADAIRVTLEDSSGCPRYMGVVIRGVQVGPSPRWLADRLTSIGLRPINNVVDATNYLLHELGQPMHAFDASRIQGEEINVRRARAGERLKTLDGIERALDADMLVIADASRAQAIAGVIGGADSEVTESTSDLFLEIATFDPASVRRTRRILGISTDASYRFERGTDPELPPVALARAASLIVAVAGGAVAQGAVDLYPQPWAAAAIGLRPERVERLLGVDVERGEITRERGEITRLLQSVGFEVSPAEGGALSVRVPSWRRDCEREVDIIEEVARLYGYDRIPVELRAYRPGTVPNSPLELTSRRVRDRLVSLGLLEARPMPFVAGADESHLRLANPLAENEAHLRRSILETLARRAEYNLAQMQGNVRLFEIGSVFIPGARDKGLPRELVCAGVIIMGQRRPHHFKDGPPPTIDEWDAKGLAEELAGAAYPGAEVMLEPVGEDVVLWRLTVDGEARGEVRLLALDAPPWAAPAFGVELVLAELSAAPQAPRGQGVAGREGRGADTISRYAPALSFTPLAVTPASGFDLALLVPDDISSARVEEVMRRAGGALLEQIALKSEYRDASLPERHRSLAWELTFRDPSRTLQAKEIAGRREKLLRVLEKELGIRPRTA
jgi:phenylalanyl-tRNA synthetase beta chain